MNRVRLIAIILIILCFICVFPPFINIYNKGGFILGVPTFFVGILVNTIVPIFILIFLYVYENKINEK